MLSKRKRDKENLICDSPAKCILKLKQKIPTTNPSNFTCLNMQSNACYFHIKSNKIRNLVS